MNHVLTFDISVVRESCRAVVDTCDKDKDKALVAGAWTEREKMYHGGSFLKLADDDMDIQNPEAQNRELGGF